MMRLVAFLPYRSISPLGRMLGKAYMRLVPKRRKIAEVNIRLCFPDQDEVWHEQILRECFESIGISLLETALNWWGSDRKLRHLGHVTGMENLQQAVNAGKGVLLLSAHFLAPEVGGRYLVMRSRFNAMYRHSSNALMDHIILSRRERYLEHLFSSKDVRGMIRSLRRGEIVWYATDQNSARKESVFVDFFGIKASSNTATARLAKMTGAAVVPFLTVRREDGSGYDVRLEPALENYPSGDLETDTQRINDLVEGWVREYPAQYLWTHRRFRTRPDRREPSFYE
jgi:KDO2-lipid IV(A) lauroyltransferase